MNQYHLRRWARRKVGKAYADKDAKIVKEVAAKIEAGEGNTKLLKLAKGVDPEHNPPDWVADKALWERAKKAVEKNWEQYDQPYAVVAHVYERMGGTTR